MSNKLQNKIVLILMITSLILNTSSQINTTNAASGSQSGIVRTSRELMSFGSISTSQRTNGIWVLTSELTTANCALLGSMNINNVYPALGDWHTDGSITYHDGQKPENIIKAVAIAHAAGLKVYAWVMEGYGGPAMDLSSSILRSRAINNLVNLVQTLGVDGIADDCELWHEGADLVSYFNAATIAMHSIGKEYFTTLVMGGYWDSHQGEYGQILVDRIQPMLYLDLNEWWMTESRFKSYFDFCLSFAKSPVGVSIMSTGSEGRVDCFVRAMEFMDEEIAGGLPTIQLNGVDVWWLSYMDSSDWVSWAAWGTT